jgi:hypothetical protein
MDTDKGNLIVELTGEQCEAALNIAHFLRDERSAGRQVDMRMIGRLGVHRHKRDLRARVIEPMVR